MELELPFDPTGLDISADHPQLGEQLGADVNAVAFLQQPASHEAGIFAALQHWIVQCGLQGRLNLRQQCEAPSLPGCVVQLRVRGNPVCPDLDRSNHGRAYEGVLYHGTAMSHVPAILSAGCLLRCSVPTRGKHCIWSSNAHTHVR